MKNRLTTMTLAIILFTSVLMNVSCKDTSQNNTTTNNAASNTATNVNQNNSVQNSEPISALGEDCSGTNEDKIYKVKRKMKQTIRGSNILDPQYREDGSRNFNFNVSDVSGDVVLNIWGFVYTEPEDKVDELNKIFKKFVKKGCVAKVIFDEPTDDKTTAPQGFEYNLCEYPNGVCSNGECRQGCLLLKPEDNMNADATANR